MTTYQYGFIADDGPVSTHCFGFPFDSAYMANHAGAKSYWDSLQIVRRRSDADEWEPVPDDDPTRKEADR